MLCASDGALGCISCHDPHRLPSEKSKVAYYKARCLACHADRGCALPALDRAERGNEHDCIACHMPRAPTSDIRHLATTLHSIPRDRERALRKRRRARNNRSPARYSCHSTVIK